MASSSHDWVDILAATGPTLATVFAGVATIAVYLRGEKFQQRLVRPLLVVKHQINADADRNTRWILSVGNEGQGAANLDSLTVVAADEIVSPEPLQSPTEYWQGILHTLGVLRVRTLEDAHILIPPLSISPRENIILFDTNMQGQRSDISKAIARLELRLHYQSALGEQFVIRHRYGHGE